MTLPENDLSGEVSQADFSMTGVLETSVLHLKSNMLEGECVEHVLRDTLLCYSMHGQLFLSTIDALTCM